MGSVAGILLAAGKGSRMAAGEGVKKQFRLLAGRPVLHWSLSAFERAPTVDIVIVVTGTDDVATVENQLRADSTFTKIRSVTPGGASRRESVVRGLALLDDTVEWVVVHDGARPFVDPYAIETVLQAAQEEGAATTAVPAKETIKRVNPGGRVLETPDRSTLWATQTPQAFSRKLLVEAHRQMRDVDATDDCGLLEAMGAPVRVVMGDDRNVKITTEADWVTVNALAAEGDLPVKTRTVTGFGFDVHRLAPNRPLILGGVALAHGWGLEGHSDADVLVHAVIDAVLGASSLGDIGSHFPDTDEAFKGADSLQLLRAACEKVDGTGARIVHVDAFISAEAPRLLPHVDDMRRNLARVMGIDANWVNVKAGTGEGAGPVGRGEVIEARAVATLERPT